MVTIEIKTEPGVVESPNLLCRLCLSEGSLDDVFGEEGLRQRILDYLSIEITFEDRTSKIICAICRSRVNEFHLFRERCHEVQHVLQSMLQDKDLGTAKRQIGNNQLTVLETNISAAVQKYQQYQCDTCQKVFKSKKYLLGHQKIHEPKEHTCMQCGKSFTRRQDLNKHMKAHANITKNIEVNETELTVVNLRNIKSEPQEDETQTILTLDSKFMKSSENLKANDKDLLPKISVRLEPSKKVDAVISNVNQLSCDICQKTFKSNRTLRSHKKVIHEVKAHICTICERPFSLRRALLKHIETHRSIHERKRAKPVADTKDVIRPHKCDKCEKAFRRKGRLWEHNKKVHGPRTHECHICGYRFTTRDQLTKHLQRHTRNRDSTEDFCQLQLVQQKDQRQFADKALAETNATNSVDQNFDASLTKCEKCQKVFTAPKSLWLHYKFAHNPKKLKCSVCNVDFVSNIRLEKHMQANHKQEDGSCQPLKCEVCNKVFQFKARLRRHMMNHGPRKYCCSVCNKTFGVEQNLKSHMKSHKNLHSEYQPDSEDSTEHHHAIAPTVKLENSEPYEESVKDAKDRSTTDDEFLFEAGEFKIEPE